MTVLVEKETEDELGFDYEELLRRVAQEAVEQEDCPYSCEINLTLTDNEGIRALNRECRNTDRETDVLSFPNVDFEEEGVFDIDEDREADCFDPETGELVLGDIMISVDRVYGQAQEYGHSVRREFAFLVAHSMLHLCGYDHMEEEERARMERRQEEILTGLGITRD